MHRTLCLRMRLKWDNTLLQKQRRIKLNRWQIACNKNISSNIVEQSYLLYCWHFKFFFKATDLIFVKFYEFEEHITTAWWQTCWTIGLTTSSGVLWFVKQEVIRSMKTSFKLRKKKESKQKTSFLFSFFSRVFVSYSKYVYTSIISLIVYWHFIN